MSAHPSPAQLGAYLDGELDASARAAVDVHLRECGECGAHLSELSAVDDAARAVPLDVPAGYFEDFAPRVRARLAKKAPARWRPPAWGWAAAAAVLLAVITPLALQEQRLASKSVAERAEPVPAPAASGGERLEQDAKLGAKQDEGLGWTMQPPATLPAPQAPAPSVAAPEAMKPLPESRLGRRDQAVEVGRDEVAALGAPASPKREAAPEQGPADAVRSKEEKLNDDQIADLRALGYVSRSAPEEQEAQAAPKAAGAPAPAAAPPASSQRQHGPRAQNTVPTETRIEERKAAQAVLAKDRDRAGYADEPAAGTVTGALGESVEVTGRSRDVGQGAAWAKYRSLADGAPPRSDGDARLLREAWRNFADKNPGHPQADEARVRVVEAGALAYRLGHRPQDRETALRDGRAYLERPPAPQADRVRAALKTLEPAPR